MQKPELFVVRTMSEFMRPILQWARRGSGRFTLREARDAMSDYFNLSAKARSELTGGGNVEKVYDRTRWSVWHLKRACLLRQIGRGYYEITDAGKKEAFSSDEVMTKTYLADNFPGLFKLMLQSINIMSASNQTQKNACALNL